MAKITQLVHLDLNQNELQNAKIQNLSAHPTSPSPVPGQIYFNTTDDKAYIWDGTNWMNAVSQDTTVTYSIQDGELSENNFTNADHSKLNAIEASADVTDTTNVTAAGALMDSEVTNLAFVKALAKGISDGNVLTANEDVADDDFLRINGTEVEGRTAAQVVSDLGLEAGATADQTNAEIVAAVEAGTDSNTFTDADHTKLDGIEASATADQTDAEIRTAVGAATDSNVFTDADHTKLDGIEASATTDQTDAEIRAAVEAATDSNVFTDADHSKLNALEASADVTDTANVKTALAGPFSNNEVTIGDSNDAVTIGMDLTVTGDLIVSGTTTTVNSTVVSIADPIFELGTSSSDDNLDRGLKMKYNSSGAKFAFMGFDDSTGKFTMIPDATDTSSVFSGTAGTLVMTTFEGALSGNATTATGLAGTGNIASTGDVVWEVDFNGLDVTAAATIQEGVIDTAELRNDAVTADKLANSINSAIAANTAKVTNVTTNLSSTTNASQLTINSSDGDNVVIAQASGTIAGVMTTAHHDKLDGIESGATADQTKSDIEGLAIQTVGTVTSGSWTATDVGVAHGGTGASNASTARTNLGVAYASDEDALAGSSNTVVLTPGNLAARSYKAAIGDGSDTSITVTHSLGTKDVIVQMYDTSSYETVYAQVVRTSDNVVTASFNSAPATGDITILITKID